MPCPFDMRPPTPEARLHQQQLGLHIKAFFKKYSSKKKKRPTPPVKSTNLCDLYQSRNGCDL